MGPHRGPEVEEACALDFVILVLYQRVVSTSIGGQLERFWISLFSVHWSFWATGVPEMGPLTPGNVQPLRGVAWSMARK